MLKTDPRSEENKREEENHRSALSKVEKGSKCRIIQCIIFVVCSEATSDPSSENNKGGDGKEVHVGEEGR